MSNNMQSDYRNIRQSQILTTKQSSYSDLRSDCNMHYNDSSDYSLDSFPIGMAYVPWQKWQNIYEPCDALDAGTLFKDLNLRFYGVRGCHR